MGARSISVVVKVALKLVRRQQTSAAGAEEERLGLLGEERSRRQVDNIGEIEPPSRAVSIL
jgi:hypothetical protein